MPVWVVTGGSGFLGRHLLDELREEVGLEVVTVGRKPFATFDFGEFIEVDLANAIALKSVMERIRPEVVIHVAGRTPPADPPTLYQANTVNTLNLLDACTSGRIVLAGSAAELGPVAVNRLPVSEEEPCKPVNAYGLSKWLSSCAGLVGRSPLQVMIGRIFNPIGPGLPPSQAFGRFAAQLADPAVERIMIGDLEPRRDFIDVRDVARAFIAIARRGRPGNIYNIGTGQSQRIGDGLDGLIARSGRSIAIEHDPALIGMPGPLDSRASLAKIVEHTGWRPVVSFETSLDDLWNEAKPKAG